MDPKVTITGEHLGLVCSPIHPPVVAVVATIPLNHAKDEPAVLILSDPQVSLFLPRVSDTRSPHDHWDLLGFGGNIGFKDG